MARELPILMHGRSVRGILAGRKWQTRRPVKPQPRDDAHSPRCRPPQFYDRRDRPMWTWMVGEGPSAFATGDRPCPYGAPGDLLYVKETFYVDDVRYDGGPLPPREYIPPEVPASIYYRADGECCDQIPECQCAEVGKPRWRPSIYMPKWAARLWLRVTDVRVERLKKIRPEDAYAEGIRCSHGETGEDCDPFKCAVEPYLDLWAEMHHGKDGLSVQDNPWVWVINFDPVTLPEGGDGSG